MTTYPRRVGLTLSGLLIAAWALLYYVHSCRLSYGTLDAWALFSPGVVAPRLQAIRAPLLGSFLGADHTWGLHWPGAPLLYSCLFAVVPWSAAAGVLLFMALTFGSAAATFCLVRRYAGDPWVAGAAATVILADRELYRLGQINRPEVAAALVLAWLVWLLAGLSADRDQGWRVAAVAVGLLLCPLLHPVLLPLGGLLGGYASWQAWRAGRTGRAVLWMGGYVAGVAAFAGWFYFQPDAWRQLQVNGRGNVHPFAWGGTFLAYLHETAPLYTSAWLYALAFAGALWWWRRPDEFIGPGAVNRDGRVVVLALLGGTALAQVFPNTLYQTILLPEAVVCAVLAARWLVRRGLGRGDVTAVLVSGVMGFAAIHGAFWAVRTYRYFQAGRPDFRAELHALVLSLPPARTVLIPDLLWEEGVRQPDRFLLYTLPFPCEPPIRAAYERGALARTVPGDLLLVDPHDLVSLTTPLPPGQWEEIHRYLHQLPGRKFWGYELVLYRKRAPLDDDRQPPDPGGIR